MIRWMVVGLHGYGGAGAEMRSRLVAALPPGAPEPRWLTPDGPLPATLARGGFAWHGLTRRPDAMASQSAALMPSLCAEVRERCREAGLSARDVAAVGFSQGGVLAAGLLAAGACSAAVTVCAPILIETKTEPIWQGARLLQIAGGSDRTLPRDQLGTDHPLFASGAAEFVELPAMGHEFGQEAAAKAIEFAFSALGFAREESVT
jgi:predicted esterase